MLFLRHCQLLFENKIYACIKSLDFSLSVNLLILSLKFLSITPFICISEAKIDALFTVFNQIFEY